MSRISVVTGAASGIGQATTELLRSRDERVIGVDLHDADITADLSTQASVDAMVAEVTKASGGTIDAIFSIAGLAIDKAVTVRVNFFGMTRVLTGLRPLLLGSRAPRAAAIASMASLMDVDDELMAALAAGDEAAAVARGEALEGSGLIYNTTKRAFAKWIRRTAPTPEWAGASIPLNAVAPGVIRTAMTADLLTTAEAENQLLTQVPMPLNGIAEPIVVARLLAWLNSPENTHLCGQVVFVDGGSDVDIRGDAVW